MKLPDHNLLDKNAIALIMDFRNSSLDSLDELLEAARTRTQHLSEDKEQEFKYTKHEWFEWVMSSTLTAKKYKILWKLMSPPYNADFRFIIK